MDSETLAPPPSLPTRVREVRGFRLPVDQIERIREAGGPLAEVDLSRISHALIAAVEVDGQLVAYWPVWKAVHAEPLWIAEPYRQSLAVSRALLAEVDQAVEEMGDPVVFAIIGELDLLTNGRQASRLGFQRVPGDLYYLIRPPDPDPVTR